MSYPNPQPLTHNPQPTTHNPQPTTNNQQPTTNNLYIHFPFCRRKCSYCVLYSRVGVSRAERDAYVAKLKEHLQQLATHNPQLTTIYFGGGSPALCDLSPLSSILTTNNPQLSTHNPQPATHNPQPATHNPQLTTHNSQLSEFTVELHPLDVTEDKLLELRDLGVNRISMGVQSLDDAVLAHMGRGYDSATAAHAFALVKKHFDNAGIDLIVGYPGERLENLSDLEHLGSWGLRHCSVYALQNERRLADVPDDETTMNRIRDVGAFLKTIGLERYEISNYAVPGFECRHNLAVWRGEDYVGLGDGAAGRVGLTRTLNFGGRNPKTETVTPERDEVERTIFRLRTREGLDASRHPEWIPVLTRFVDEGLLTLSTNNQQPTTHNPQPTTLYPLSSILYPLSSTYFLTPRGTEVCDAILAELV